YNNPTGSNYTGTVHFASTDASAFVPPDTAISGGTGIFSAMFLTPGFQTITVSDQASPGITGTSNLIANASIATSARYFKISVPSGVQTTGVPFVVTVTALDATGNLAPAYSGKVHFTSSDAGAVLPADSTLTGGVG